MSFDRSADYWIDVESFQASIEAALPSADIPALQDAVDLYQGEFLDGLSLPDAPEYEEWLLMQQNVLRGCCSRRSTSWSTIIPSTGRWPPALRP